MPEKTALMSIKRGKLTAGKARERVASLEESIAARQHRLEQLDARLERSEAPDERLLTAKSRLERRLELEKDQLEKLLKLLSRETSQPEESGEYFASEEIDDLHRSFEEVRQNLAQMQARIDSNEMPRDLTTRMSSFEERVARREEVDSELFGQVLSLQTALDQERQAIRRLSRRTREQDQSLDALREAVEDSVLATVDLAERLDELEESLSEGAESKSATRETSATVSMTWSSEIESLRELVHDARSGLMALQTQVIDSLASAAAERQELRQAQAAFVQQQQQAEVRAQRAQEEGPGQPGSGGEDEIVNQRLAQLLRRVEALESAPLSSKKVAVFAKNGVSLRQVANFSGPVDSRLALGSSSGFDDPDRPSSRLFGQG